MISAEFLHDHESGNSPNDMKSFMDKQGYKVHSVVTAPNNHANDYIFVKKDLWHIFKQLSDPVEGSGY